MAHPYLRVGFEAFEERVVLFKRLEVGTSILTCASWSDLASHGMGHVLRTVADAEDGVLAADAAKVYLEGLWVVDAEW